MKIDKRVNLFLPIILAIIFGFIGCKSDSSTGSSGNSATAKIANADRGEAIYRANCYACHGVDPTFDGVLGPAINGSSKELVIIRLKQGRGHYPKGYTPKRDTKTMPPQAHLVKDIGDLMAYINKDHGKTTNIVTAKVDPVVKAGKVIYDSSCAGCHQPEGIGKVGFAPNLTNEDFLAIASDKFIKNTIKIGRAGTNMIGFGFLGDDSIDKVVAYLRSYQKSPAKKYNHNFKAKGNPTKGKALFNQHCAQCHGSQGKGYLLGGSGTGIGLKGFLSTVDDAFIKQTMLTGRSGTPMRAFSGPLGLSQLSDKELNNIIVYLRFLENQIRAKA